VGTADEYGADEVARLRDCLNDLAGMVAVPAWTTGEPDQIVDALLSTLLQTLRLDFVCVRLNGPGNGRHTETARVAGSRQGNAGAREISQALDTTLGVAPPAWPPRAHVSIRDVDLSVGWAPLGVRGEVGVLVAGSARSGFPTQAEKVVLDVAASQATTCLLQARLMRDSERDSRVLMDSIPGLVALMSVEGELQFANRQILEYTGSPLVELKHWGTNDIVHPEDLPHVIQAFTQSIASGTPYSIVQRLRRSDGAYLWFQNDGFPLRDASGHIVQWCVLLTNIDDRKRAEESLAASENELKLSIDTIPALAWSASPEGSAEFFNQHYLDFIGLSADRASGSGWTAAVHPEDLGGLVVTWQQIMASAAPGEAEARLRRHDGEYRWFLFRVNPLRDESGAIVKWYGVNTDIEDRKRAETEVRRAYDSFADAQRLSKTGSFITDLVGDDHNWSEEAYRIFDFDPATEVSVQRIRDIIHPDDLPSFESVIARGMSGVDVDFAFRITTAGGEVKHVRGIAHVIEQVEGRPMFVGALQDVTESVVAEEALNKARSELTRVARFTTLSALTASIAHEVNQPLSGIITNASTGLRMLDDDPPNVAGARETVRRTLRDGNRASDVIARLRALFSKREFTLEPLDLNEAAREVIALALSDLQRNRVTLQSDFADDLPIVPGDRIQLQQVILNLLVNASDAMVDVHDRPRLLLVKTDRATDDGVRLVVRDAGVGLPPEGPDSLFNPFYTTKSNGMGIGLFVSRSIIEHHQGRLWAEPNDGAPGATFVFSIPREAPGGLDTAPGLGTS
jgi:PAS domain S-box-containing protein